MNDRLEYLIASKPFGKLNAEERYFVTENISEAEYECLHFLLKNTGHILHDAPAPPPAIRENLMAAMRQVNAPAPTQHAGGAILRVLRARIPAWQAAAAVLILMGLHFFTKKESTAVVQKVTEYVHTTDTIYREVEIPAAPVAKPRINRKPVREQRAQVGGLALADSSARAGVPDSFALMVSQPKGQSARQTEDLWQFFGEVH